MSRPSLTGLLDGLEARGWVRRVEVDGDRRGVGLEVTAEGRAALRAAERATETRLEHVLEAAAGRRAARCTCRPRRLGWRLRLTAGRRGGAVRSRPLALDRPTPEPAPPEAGGWIRRLAPFLLAHKRNVAIAFGVSIFGQAVSAVTPVIEKVIVDDVIGAHERPLAPWLTVLVARGIRRLRRGLRPPVRRRPREPRRAVRPAQRGVRAAATTRLREPRPDADRTARVARQQRRRACCKAC